MVRQYERLCVLQRTHIRVGDTVYVKTINSVYQIRVEEDRMFTVSGGWFDRRANSPVQTTIVGCTWGGSVINVGVVAAVGLSLEFGNRVVTSAIKSFVVIPKEKNN